MTTAHRRPISRGGFTLIELLVVIAIIAVLASLITAGAQRAIITANLAQGQAELGQMAVGIDTFKTKYHLAGKWVPSKIRLREDGLYNQTPIDPKDQVLEQESYKWIQLWRPALGLPQYFPINWSGRNVKQDWATGKYQWFDLEGDQCLVFFLSGIPGPEKYNTNIVFKNVTNNQSVPNVVYAATGFATDPHNPSAQITQLGTLNTNVRADQPIFEFKSNRLINRGGKIGGYVNGNTLPLGGTVTAPGDPNWRFASYLDPLGSSDRPLPFIYYTATQRGNDYNYQDQPGTSDCSGLAVFTAAGAFTAKIPPQNVFPRQDATRPTHPWLNGNSFQIMSAAYRGDYLTGPYGPGASQ